MADRRAHLKNAPGEILEYLPRGGRCLAIGESMPGRLVPQGYEGLRWIVEPPGGWRARRWRRHLPDPPPVLAARSGELPIAPGALDALLAVGPLDTARTVDALAALCQKVRDRGRLVLAEPASSGSLGRILRAYGSDDGAVSERQANLLLSAGLADIRQDELDRPKWGRWIVTCGTVRKL